MRDAAKAADGRHVVLQRRSLAVVCFIVVSFQRLAAGYRDPGSEDSGCTDSRKEGCHPAVLLAVSSSGKLLAKGAVQSNASRQKREPTESHTASGDAAQEHEAPKTLREMFYEEAEHESYGMSKLFDGDFSNIMSFPLVTGFMLVLCMCIGAFNRPAPGGSPAPAPAGGSSVGGHHEAFKIDVGHILRCAAEEAEIYAKVDSSDVIGKVSKGEDILADGKPVEHEGAVMVPVQPQGAVKLELFTTNQAANTKEGTILVCIADASHPADVFQSAASTTMLDSKIQRGEKIVAASKPEWVEGYMMLPIKPTGAVEADLFEIVEAKDLVGEAAAEDVEDTPEQAAIKQRMKELKKEKTRLMFEQASRKDQLASVLKSIMDAEAELEGLKPISDEEAQRKADEAMRAMDTATEKGVMSAIAVAVPMLRQTKQIYSKVEQRVQKANEQAIKLAQQETKHLMADLQNEAGLKDLVVDATVLDNLNAPSLAAIVASALAPAQLRLLHTFNGIFMLLSVVFILLDVSVVLWDWQVPCMNKPEDWNQGMTSQQFFDIWWKNASTNAMYMWFFVDFFVHFSCFLIRWRVTKNVGAVLETISKPPPVQMVDHPLDALRVMLEYYLSTGAEALVQLDEVMASLTLYIASWSVCFDTIWLVYSVQVVWETPWSLCATVGLCILRVRSTLFLILLVVYILQIGGFVLSQLFQSQSFSLAICRAADKGDEVLDLGFPVFRILVQALVVRSSHDMIAIQMNLHQMERENIERQKEILEKDLAELEQKDNQSKEAIEKLSSEKDAHAAKFADAADRKAELEKAKQDILKNSDKFFDDVKKKTAEVAARAEQQAEELQRDGIGVDTAGWSDSLSNIQEGAGAMSMMGTSSMSMQDMLAQAQSASQAAQNAAANSGLSAADAPSASGLLQATGASTTGIASGFFAEAPAGVDADVAAGAQSSPQAPRGSLVVVQESQGDDAAGSAAPPDVTQAGPAAATPVELGEETF